MSSADAECQELRKCYDDVWSCLDELFGSFDAEDWSRRHGKDWVFADLPYHLVYFDRDVIATPVAAGENYPSEDRWLMQSLAEIAGWNQVKFNERPPKQTAGQSVEQWHVSRDAIQRTLVDYSDADLDSVALSPFSGFSTIRDLLHFGIAHCWGQLTEAMVRLGREQPVPMTSTTSIGVVSTLCF